MVPQPLQPERLLSQSLATCLAIDIGGTKMAVGIVDRSGSVLSHRVAPTPQGGSADELCATLDGLIDAALADDAAPPIVVGIGCGGPMDLGLGTVSPLNIAGWRDFDLRGHVAAKTGLTVGLDNDAKALALGEGWIGAAKGISNYLAMVVSTGVGGGLVLDGSLVDGASGNAGHIGHVVVEPLGRACACGGMGCLEAEASGTAISAMTGRPASDAEISVRRRTGTLVGRAVASTAALVDISLCVVAGSVALGFGDTFFDAANAELRRRAGLAFTRGVTIVPAGLDSLGPLIGAAAVGWRTLT